MTPPTSPPTLPFPSRLLEPASYIESHRKCYALEENLAYLMKTVATITKKRMSQLFVY